MQRLMGLFMLMLICSFKMLWQLLHLCFVGPSLLLLRYHLNSSVFLSVCLKVTLSAAANLPLWLRLLRQLMTSGHCSCLRGCVLMLISVNANKTTKSGAHKSRKHTAASVSCGLCSDIFILLGFSFLHIKLLLLYWVIYFTWAISQWQCWTGVSQRTT